MKYYMLAISFPLWGIGLYLLWLRISFLISSTKTEGKLSGWKETGTLGGGLKSYWYPIVSYEASDGKTYEITGVAGSSRKPAYEMGHPFPVLYAPAHPEAGFVFTFLNYWAAPLAFMLLGTASTWTYLKISGIV